MDFSGPTMDDFLSQPHSSSQQPNDGHSWSPSDFSFLQSRHQQHQQQQQQQHQQHQQQHQQYNNEPFNSNNLGAIYVSNIPLLSHPPPQQQQPTQQFDENGQPIKIRKKPGRKPNPASPALRKAQNRAAQRAFRERKERHLKDLEGTIRQLREQRNSAIKELNQTKGKMDSFRAENWYLKGVVLTLQFVCLHHNIHIPTHSPYLTEEALSEMAKTTPHAIEAYVNAYTRNNINLKPTMAAHFANSSNEKDVPLQKKQPRQQQQKRHSEEDENVTSDGQQEDDMEENEDNDTDMMMNGEDEESNLSPESTYVKIEEEEEEDETMTQWVKQHNEKKKRLALQQQEKEEKGEGGEESDTEEQSKQPNPSSISAIQRIRLQLRVQSAISSVGKSAVRLQPTILQLAIPHDPRIDLIPTPHMRDRMIIFRDQMDYDRCFAMLLNGAFYHGGDPTMSASWELPAEFFTEFWYLAINYDVNRTNNWRRLKGLPDINGVPNTEEEEWSHLFQQQQQHQQQQQLQQQQQQQNLQQQQQQNIQQQHASPPSSSSESVWTDDVFAQMTAGMPTLQPLDSHHLTSGFDFGSPNAEYQQHMDPTNSHPLFEQLMGSPPATRHNRSPSIGAMMDLMNSLSTDMPQQQ
ncbi:hypothetical protein HPULCUR_005855 [Helicostylum pulchrum]|uniref:BZIP domain-containing protein n=1 Tax=Helicostylum pulchrum TaxID=562976 RepID=A0ABP9Y142_9FUNG